MNSENFERRLIFLLNRFFFVIKNTENNYCGERFDRPSDEVFLNISASTDRIMANNNKKVIYNLKILRKPQ